MSVNRYRLRHSRAKAAAARAAAEQLLEQPDRLIGLILICNNFVNIVAASLVTVITLQIGGADRRDQRRRVHGRADHLRRGGAEDVRRAVSRAARAAGRARLPRAAARSCTRVVWITNLIANGVLKLLGVSREQASRTSLSREELRTVVAEASTVIPHRHQRMLMSILDLERLNVEDIMVPRNEIAGIDVNDDWDDILEQLRESRHTRLPGLRGQPRHRCSASCT